MSKIVRIDDTSDHGGVMVSASANFRCNSRFVCVDQDLHQCPIAGHGVTPVTGTGSFRSSARSVIKTGDVAGCGAIIITGSDNTST